MTWYETALQILLIGIANGSIIALIALGYTLVYGIIELINFAHGDVFMIGTMLALTLLTWVPSMMGVRRASLLPDADRDPAGARGAVRGDGRLRLAQHDH